MKRYITIVIVILSINTFYSCSDKVKNVTEKKETSKKENTWVIESPLKKFIFPSDSPFITDTNTLVFLKDAYDDTSFLVHIKQQGSVIRGLCYILSPKLHRSFEDFKDEKHKLLFFDGFSFELENSEWDSIKRTTNRELLNIADSIPNNSICIHCPYYNLNFKGSQRSTANSQMQDEFVNYESFIKNNIINKFRRSG